MIHRNVVTDFNRTADAPSIDPTAFVHPLAAVIGRVTLGRRVMVCPFASIRGDEGMPIAIGEDSNVQDGAVVHALETERHSRPVSENLVEFLGRKYAVYLGQRVSLAHQSQVHGPALVGNDVFVGMKSLVFRTTVGNNCVIEPGCLLMDVTVPGGRYVPAGTVLKDQARADELPPITEGYAFRTLNRGVVHVNVSLAEGYRKAGPA